MINDISPPTIDTAMPQQARSADEPAIAPGISTDDPANPSDRLGEVHDDEDSHFERALAPDDSKPFADTVEKTQDMTLPDGADLREIGELKPGEHNAIIQEAAHGSSQIPKGLFPAIAIAIAAYWYVDNFVRHDFVQDALRRNSLSSFIFQSLQLVPQRAQAGQGAINQFPDQEHQLRLEVMMAYTALSRRNSSITTG